MSKKRPRLSELVAAAPTPRRKTWFDKLAADDREWLRKSRDDYRAGGLAMDATNCARVIAEQNPPIKGLPGIDMLARWLREKAT